MSTKTEIRKQVYSNGQVRFEIPKVNGKRHGIANWWRDNGILECQAEFVNGLQEGLYLEWFRGGSRQLIASYKRGRMNGVSIPFRYLSVKTIPDFLR